jgi:hypothetical protein
MCFALDEQIPLGARVAGNIIGKGGTSRYYWMECPLCLERRWATPRSYETNRTTRMCRPCSVYRSSQTFMRGNLSPPKKTYVLPWRSWTK